MVVLVIRGNKAMERIKHKQMVMKNKVDDLTDALVNIMQYSDSSVDYPNIDAAEVDDGVVAEWFYPIYNGMNDFSELTAILMYTSQESTFEEIGEVMLGIALTEMKHYAKLGDFICKLGGSIKQKYNNSGVTIGNNAREALEIAYESEVKTINFYDAIKERIEKTKSTTTTAIALQLIDKIKADEEVHKRLLNAEFLKYPKKENDIVEKIEVNEQEDS
jgi:hypothetical protein